jgi:hypothetical protein
VHVDLPILLIPRIHSAELKPYKTRERPLLEDQDSLRGTVADSERAEESPAIVVVAVVDGFAFGEGIGFMPSRGGRIGVPGCSQTCLAEVVSAT